MFRYVLIIAALLIPAVLPAQNHFCGKNIITGSGGVVEWPFDTSGGFNTAGAKFWINFSQDPSSSPITEGTGTYDFVVNGTPVRNTDGTYPAGLAGTEGYRWDHDSSSDGLTRADDDALDLTTKFTLITISTSLIVSGGQLWLRKKSSGPNAGYRFYMFLDDIYLNTYNTSTTTLLGINVGAIGKINCVVTTLDGTAGVGSSTAYMYVDEYTASTSSSMNPVANAAAPTQIHMPGSMAGMLHYVAYYNDTIWTSAQARHFCRNFYGITSNSGGVVSTTSATPAATFLSDSATPSFLTATSTDTSMIGAYGWYAHDAIDNLIQRQSFETASQWTETLVAGDGSAANALQSDATAAHGLSSDKMTLTGTTSSAVIASACVTSGIAADLYVQAQAKKDSGTSEAAIRIHEYSDGACSTPIGTTDIRAAADITTSWAEYGGLFASGSWNGSTSSWTLELVETCNGGCVTHWDAIQARSASVPTDSYCVICDTDATCSCTTTVATIPQSLTSVGWTIEAKVRSPIDGAVATPWRRILHVPGTAGDNNRIDFYWTNDLLTLDVYDSAGVKKTATHTAAGNADTEYTAYAEHTAGGVIKVCWDGGCGSTVSAATMDGISSSCYLGNDGTNGGDLWIKNLELGAL